MEHRTNLGLTEKQWGALISGEKEVKRGMGAYNVRVLVCSLSSISIVNLDFVRNRKLCVAILRCKLHSWAQLPLIR